MNRKECWRKYKVARWLAIPNIPLIVLIAVLTVLRIDSNVMLALPIIYLFTIGGYNWIKLSCWSCPRCNKLFNYPKSQWEIYGSTRCSNCGLQVGDLDYVAYSQTKASSSSGEQPKDCYYSHLPEDNPTGICRGCGKNINDHF